MRKTTIYLPEELKERVALAALRQRRSEADLIRSAIDEFTKEDVPRPTLPLFASGEVIPIDDFDEALRGFGED